jgi:hypothetical protein
MSQTQAWQVFGESLGALSNWMGIERAGEGRLNRVQAARIDQLIIDSLHDQLKLPLYLWTCAAVVVLIERE